jgi:hypothetical protein
MGPFINSCRVGLGGAEGSTPPETVSSIPVVDVNESPKVVVGVENVVTAVPETDEEPVKLLVKEFTSNWEKSHPLPNTRRLARPYTPIIENIHFLPLMSRILQEKDGKID